MTPDIATPSRRAMLSFVLGAAAAALTPREGHAAVQPSAEATPDNAQLLARLRAAYDLGGVKGANAAGEILETLFGDVVEGWHNYVTDGHDGPKPRAQVRQLLRAERETIASAVTDFDQKDVQLVVSDQAIVTTARIVGGLADGSRFEIPMCVIYRRDSHGWIVRTEAWANGQVMQDLRERVRAIERRAAGAQAAP